MREIKFRGKRIDNGEWVYGYLANGGLISAGAIQIGIESPNSRETAKMKAVIQAYQVDPKTVGQYIDLTDKNGEEIYEGDIVKAKYEAIVEWFTQKTKIFETTGEVVFLNEDNKFGRKMSEFVIKTKYDWIRFFNCVEVEVIGNIYDNPELLEEIDERNKI